MFLPEWTRGECELRLFDASKSINRKLRIPGKRLMDGEKYPAISFCFRDVAIPELFRKNAVNMLGPLLKLGQDPGGGTIETHEVGQMMPNARRNRISVKAVRLISSLFIIWSMAFSPSLICTGDEKPADRILIEKKARKLTLLRGSVVIRSYRIALGNSPEGPKTCQGDCRTPEGHYVIDGRNKSSHYHWSLHISYPNEADRMAARKHKCRPGGDIFIHGLPNGYGWIGQAHRMRDWTLGCIAVTNEEIEEIWHLVPNGTAVEIRP